MSKRPPKRYECTECGFISNKFTPLKFPSMSFAACYKCRGRLMERDEWLDWLHSEQRKKFI